MSRRLILAAASALALLFSVRASYWARTSTFSVLRPDSRRRALWIWVEGVGQIVDRCLFKLLGVEEITYQDPLRALEDVHLVFGKCSIGMGVVHQLQHIVYAMV